LLLGSLESITFISHHRTLGIRVFYPGGIMSVIHSSAIMLPFSSISIQFHSSLLIPVGIIAANFWYGHYGCNSIILLEWYGFHDHLRFGWTFDFNCDDDRCVWELWLLKLSVLVATCNSLCSFTTIAVNLDIAIAVFW
jgi:hypothetical protein